MKKRVLFLLIAMLPIVSACSEEEKKAVEYTREKLTDEALIEKRYEFYMKNLDALRAKWEACKNLEPEKLRQDPECVAAKRAAIKKL